jgi:RNA polymerase sigma factor (sigma-70 family)
MRPPVAPVPAPAELAPAGVGLLARARRLWRSTGKASAAIDASPAIGDLLPAEVAAPEAAATPLDAQAREEWSRWGRAVAGDVGCADALVRELGRSGLRLAQQMLRSREAAEDTVQEALLRLWRCPPQDRGTARLSTWFATVVLNLCRDRLAQDRREPSTDPELLDAWQDGAAPEGVLAPWSADSTPEPGRHLEQRQQDQRVADAIAALPPRQRMAVALWAYADAPVAEIARALDIETNAAHQLLHRAKSALRHTLSTARQPE